MLDPNITIAKKQYPHARDILELLKPITWFPPMWAFGCGVLSVGAVHLDQWPLIMGGIILAGPMVCAASQAVNDWFDRHVDAINEPGRPIPSGRIPGKWGLYLGILWSLASLGLGMMLGIWAFIASAFAVGFAWAYSAPPFRLKMNGWAGPALVGLSYEGVAWFTGAAVILGALPGPYILAAALIYSIGAHGIMTLNDFKAIDGDTRMGVRSLPVLYGADIAARIACAVMLGAQLLIIYGLILLQMPFYALIIAGLIAIQMRLMLTLLKDPRAKAPWFNGTGTSLYVLGMAVTAVALGSIEGGPPWP